MPLEKLVMGEKHSLFKRAKSLFYGLAFSLALGTAYCGGNSNNTQAGCRSDADCKGGRICNVSSGECVYPVSDGGLNEVIAFFSVRDGNAEIYAMGADGSNPRNLTNNLSDDLNPCWSPDGSKIAFSSDRGNRFVWDVYIMNRDGSGQRKITDHRVASTSSSYLAWSPDGMKIAFDSFEDDPSGDIYVIDIDGSNPRNLTNNSSREGQPTWSSDGSKIAFASDRENTWKIYVMGVDGSNLRKLTEGPNDGYPCWSPDGTKIVFNSKRDGKYQVYVMNADGSEQRNLTNSSSQEGSPTWSPDGTKIVFSSNRDGNSEIYIMNAADGSEQRRLTNNSAGDYSPAWSPY